VLFILIIHSLYSWSNEYPIVCLSEIMNCAIYSFRILFAASCITSGGSVNLLRPRESKSRFKFLFATTPPCLKATLPVTRCFNSVVDILRVPRASPLVWRWCLNNSAMWFALRKWKYIAEKNCLSPVSAMYFKVWRIRWSCTQESGLLLSQTVLGEFSWGLTECRPINETALWNYCDHASLGTRRPRS